ncbi:M90 family metallopeptidase [Mucilaginibacter arboris]|uniref:Peptidase n=1 Tax=Mucilaginibacter arboris TaxID=2682090 RepID=A0A7K1SYJ8_9SPHI|nr:M90 family metallopeptidase [Mucilaginibacter arboris]MVN22389.1 peptidase [Mucilaginibacter arboris]
MIFYLLAALVIIFLIGYFIFKKPFIKHSPDLGQQEKYRLLLEQHVHFYQQLKPEDQQRFVLKVEEFLQNTRIEGVGLELEDLDCVLIAASALIPIFGFKEWKYPQLSNVILYPDTFNNDFKFEGGNREIAGLVGSGFMNGQMILSRAALRKGFSASAGKENTAVHEFVHLLDKEDGATDGLPEHLLPDGFSRPWLKLVHEEIRKIENGKSDIDPYAMTNEAEFFAVAAEYFFEKPEKLKQKHPQLYEMLSRIFMQEPAD